MSAKKSQINANTPVKSSRTASGVLPILIIEDDIAALGRLRRILEGTGSPVVCTGSGAFISRLLESGKIAGIVSSTQRQDGVDATDFHEWLSQHHPGLVQSIVFTVGDRRDTRLTKLRIPRRRSYKRPSLSRGSSRRSGRLLGNRR